MSGLKLEKHLSVEFHQVGIPLLVSPQILRSRDLGQIDLARMVKKNAEWVIEVSEVKSSSVGEANLVRGQRRRLTQAQMFLSSILGSPSRLILTVGNK